MNGNPLKLTLIFGSRLGPHVPDAVHYLVFNDFILVVKMGPVGSPFIIASTATSLATLKRAPIRP